MVHLNSILTPVNCGARRGGVEVVGPTTTEGYVGRLRELVADFGLDYGNPDFVRYAES